MGNLVTVIELDPTLRLLPPECFTPTAFAHASARGTWDLL